VSLTVIVVDDMKDWAPFYPSNQVLTFQEYLAQEVGANARTRVINLCGGYEYLSDGYYCSLLAEARGHTVTPSIRALNDLNDQILYRLQLGNLDSVLGKSLHKKDRTEAIVVHAFFGRCAEPALSDLCRRLFERFSSPILEFTLEHNGVGWTLNGLKARNHRGLSDAEETLFASALELYSGRIWRQSKAKKLSRFDLAILVDPNEKMPPSDAGALKKFIKAGKSLDVDVELITEDDLLRLPEFDGLFIRTTTAIDHFTYRFAKKAESEGMVVMDDPSSILRCCNKIYLADLFRTHKVPAPKTCLLHRKNPNVADELESNFEYPIVLKIPDGSFSRGVIKVKDRSELEKGIASLFEQSAVLLAQEFLYTDFDWRIGVLNNKPLYACRYYMVKNHWQIYQHGGSKVKIGKFDTMPTFEVPKAVLQAALKATQPIGTGLYGVDVKEKDGKGYVIEVNDNPNVDSGVEDLYLGQEVYQQIMGEFVRRMEIRRRKD
jgi:glutathione synthase/RimK-type ligase-like ATP-grasp enzyme